MDFFKSWKNEELTNKHRDILNEEMNSYFSNVFIELFNVGDECLDFEKKSKSLGFDDFEHYLSLFERNSSGEAYGYLINFITNNFGRDVCEYFHSHSMNENSLSGKIYHDFIIKTQFFCRISIDFFRAIKNKKDKK